MHIEQRLLQYALSLNPSDYSFIKFRGTFSYQKENCNPLCKCFTAALSPVKPFQSSILLINATPLPWYKFRSKVCEIMNQFIKLLDQYLYRVKNDLIITGVSRRVSFRHFNLFKFYTLSSYKYVRHGYTSYLQF